MRTASEEKSIRRAVYSDARVRASENDMKKDPRKIFRRLASNVRHSVGGVQRKQRILVALSSSFSNIEELDQKDDHSGRDRLWRHVIKLTRACQIFTQGKDLELCIDIWTPAANSILGSLDALLTQSSDDSLTRDPNFNKVMCNLLTEIIDNVRAAAEQLKNLNKIANEVESGMLDLKQQLAETDFLVRDVLGMLADDLDAMRRAVAKHLRGQEAEAVIGVLNALPLGLFKSRYIQVKGEHSSAWKYVAPEHLRKESQAKNKGWCYGCWNFKCQCSRAMKESSRIAHEAELHEADTHPAVLGEEDLLFQQRLDAFCKKYEALEAYHVSELQSPEFKGAAQVSGTETEPRDIGLLSVCGSRLSRAAGDDEPGNEGCNRTYIGPPQDSFKSFSLLEKIADLKKRLASRRNQKASRNNAYASGSLQTTASDSPEKQSFLAQRDTVQELPLDDKGQDPVQRGVAPAPVEFEEHEKELLKDENDGNSKVNTNGDLRPMFDTGPVHFLGSKHSKPLRSVKAKRSSKDDLVAILRDVGQIRESHIPESSGKGVVVDNDSQCLGKLQSESQSQFQSQSGNGGRSSWYGSDPAQKASSDEARNFFRSQVPVHSPGVHWMTPQRRWYFLVFPGRNGWLVRRRRDDVSPCFGDIRELERIA